MSFWGRKAAVWTPHLLALFINCLSCGALHCSLSSTRVWKAHSGFIALKITKLRFTWNNNNKKMLANVSVSLFHKHKCPILSWRGSYQEPFLLEVQCAADLWHICPVQVKQFQEKKSEQFQLLMGSSPRKVQVVQSWEYGQKMIIFIWI